MTDKIILIHCMRDIEDFTQYSIDEGISLLETYIDKPEIDVMKFNIHRISPSTYLTKGRIAKIKEYIDTHKPDFLFWNHNINHRHQRALEQELKIPIYDRIKVILEIFQARAVSSEEKLRVALAYKQYERSRVVHAWSHLERQRGGLSKTGGPGEKQLELDKRMIDAKIDRYKRELARVSASRDVRRKGRSQLPMVAIVGYTNVGKTTLFNLLTKSQDLAEDKLFATLDPHTRRAFLPEIGTILMSDTVGFIRKFPTSLKSAFASTLEEIKYAKLILHVRNAMMPLEHKYSQEIIEILKQIDADKIPRINVWNKCDIQENDIDLEHMGDADISDPDDNTDEQIDHESIDTGTTHDHIDNANAGDMSIDNANAGDSDNSNSDSTTNQHVQNIKISCHTKQGIDELKHIIQVRLLDIEYQNHKGDNVSAKNVHNMQGHAHDNDDDI